LRLCGKFSADHLAETMIKANIYFQPIIEWEAYMPTTILVKSSGYWVEE
jgi:hypothetical protein